MCVVDGNKVADSHASCFVGSPDVTSTDTTTLGTDGHEVICVTCSSEKVDVVDTFTTVSIVNVPNEDVKVVYDVGTNVYSFKLSDPNKSKNTSVCTKKHGLALSQPASNYYV